MTVLPGTYRESMIVSGSASAHAPVTVQAATPDTVNISGADVGNGWQVYAGNTLMLTYPWPYQWGTCVDSAIPAGHTLQPIVLRREMIFVNTEPLTQVLSLSQMREGTFYVNEGNHTAYIWPPSGRNIGTATIEVAVRPVLLTGFANSSLVFRGLSFQYANSCRGVRALSFSNSSNILFDSVNIVWNNAGGLGINGSNHVTVKNSKANHNGEVGWTAYKVT